MNMPKYLTFTIPGFDGDTQTIDAPGVIPQGGIESGGKGATALQNGIVILLMGITVLSLFFLIWGGIKWITSEGDKTKLDAARKTLIYALVGLVLAFLSFFIVNFVGGFFNISLLGS